MKDYLFKLSKVDRQTIGLAFYVNLHVFNDAAAPEKSKVSNDDYFNASMIKKVDDKVKDEKNHFNLSELCQIIEALASTAPFFTSYKQMAKKDAEYLHRSGAFTKDMAQNYPKLAKRTWTFINHIISNNSRSNKSRNLNKVETKIVTETKRRSAFIGANFEHWSLNQQKKMNRNK